MAHEPNPQNTGTDKAAESDTGSGGGVAGFGAGGAGAAGGVRALAGVPSLIPEWRKAWRLLSVQIAAVAVVFGSLPVDQQSAMLALVGIGPERIPALLGLAVILARLVKQRE